MYAEKQVTKISRDWKRYSREIDKAKNEIDIMYIQRAAHKKGLAEGLAEGEAKIIALLKKGTTLEEIEKMYGN